LLLTSPYDAYFSVLQTGLTGVKLRCLEASEPSGVTVNWTVSSNWNATREPLALEPGKESRRNWMSGYTFGSIT